MTYTAYSNLTANLIRNCLKEPHKTQILSLSRENVQYLLPTWIDSISGKLSKTPSFSLLLFTIFSLPSLLRLTQVLASDFGFKLLSIGALGLTYRSFPRIASYQKEKKKTIAYMICLFQLKQCLLLELEFGHAIMLTFLGKAACHPFVSTKLEGLVCRIHHFSP